MVLRKKVNKKIYLGPKEMIQTRKTKSKKNMTKVMLLVAVAKPRMDVKRGKFSMERLVVTH